MLTRDQYARLLGAKRLDRAATFAFIVLTASRDAEWQRVQSNIRRDLHAACERARAELRAKGRLGEADAFPNVSPNDLRRTSATSCVQAGMSTAREALLLGHRDARMIERVYGVPDSRSVGHELAKMFDASNRRHGDFQSREGGARCVAKGENRAIPADRALAVIAGVIDGRSFERRALHPSPAILRTKMRSRDLPSRNLTSFHPVALGGIDRASISSDELVGRVAEFELLEGQSKPAAARGEVRWHHLDDLYAAPRCTRRGSGERNVWRPA